MICWVDIETTGLDEREGHILEVALVLTNDGLEEVAHRSWLVRPVVAAPIEVYLAGLDRIVFEMHHQSGLLAEVLALGSGNAPGAVEARMIETAVEMANTYQFDLDQTPIAGSTVGFDRRWLRAHMANFEALFHYRSIDVSSLTELAQRWAPSVYADRPKAAAKAHRALADARESIEYLRHYQRVGFVRDEGDVYLPREEARLLAGAMRACALDRTLPSIWSRIAGLAPSHPRGTE